LGGEAGDEGAPSCTLADSWQTIGDFQLAAGQHSNPATVVAAPPNRLYAVGIDADARAHWIVRRAEVDNPSGFTTVDDVGPMQCMERLAAKGVFQASSGAFVAVGSSSVGSSPARVVYRRSADGVTWSPAGDFTYVSGQASSPAGLWCAASAPTALRTGSCEDSHATERRAQQSYFAVPP
jgi:hypothetical protein